MMVNSHNVRNVEIELIQRDIMPFQKENKFGGSNRLNESIEVKRAKRNKYAREYRKKHPHDKVKRRKYYLLSKAREFSRILKGAK
jgi:hypothetical protein